MKKLKRPLIALLIIFALYVVATSPTEAAGIVDTSGSMLWAALEGIFGFFDSFFQFLQALVE